ncbi:uncharacterized protein LOC143527275 isoform X2 [Brachyhypopomus gauderio]|uniref:uncharacterized protein LOC143527275 isoform X2 n=1 Tax=Brachyhypopomus gauderio TaxID=698409 RepID=UPI0040423EE8
METSGVTLLTFMCVVLMAQRSDCGEDVEMRVKRGDHVTLYCDCDIPMRSNIAWFRNCSHDQQPALNIATSSAVLPRYRFTWNDTKKTYNLDIINVTQSDLGLYYCARVTGEKYYYGNRSTRLSLNDTGNCDEHSHVSSSSACSVCWRF